MKHITKFKEYFIVYRLFPLKTKKYYIIATNEIFRNIALATKETLATQLGRSLYIFKCTWCKIQTVCESESAASCIVP